MKPVNLKMKCALALFLGGILAAGPVMADKPTWAEGGKNSKDDKHDKDDKYERKNKHDKKESGRHDEDEHSAGKRGHFEERHRVLVNEYYSEQFRGRRCPPGLAKKQNGCMPPGQAKKWQIGQPLPRDVVYYTVPKPLVTQIGQPPAGYRYVRVASDILMIAIENGMVADAIRNLGR